MSRPDVEHRTEIRRVNRTTPIWIGVVVLAAIVVLLIGPVGGGADEEEGLAPPPSDPSTPTSEALVTTPSREQPPVYGLTAGGDDALVAFSTAIGPGAGGGLAVDEVQAVVVTDDVVVALVGGTVHAADPGGPFREVVGCCVEGLVPSNEPGHVWLRDGGEIALLQVQVGGFVTELEIGDAEVLGPASFGVITRDDQGVVRWHRPSFEPTDLGSSDDWQAIDAGGERLLIAVPATAGRSARLEVWSIGTHGLLFAHELEPGAAPEGLLAPDGSVVLVPSAGGAEVRDAATGALHGTLPKVSDAVWVGGNRFAATLDDQIVVSDRGLLPLRWPVLAVAEQSP